MNYDLNKPTRFLSKNEVFVIEFFAYNFTELAITKKLYVKFQSEISNNKDKKIILDERKLGLISQALDNEFLSVFYSNRYSLYDISFRECDSIENIGFSFNDLKDSSYMDSNQIFEPFMDFDISVVHKVENGIFQQQPRYNPIFMIGLVFKAAVLTCVKAYIRFDLAEAATIDERKYIMHNIIKVINPQITFESVFFKLFKKVEDMGFVFSFVGVDCYESGRNRFKLYFRFYGNQYNSVVAEEFNMILSRLGLQNGICEMFNKHQNGIWGLAISTDSFQCVNGIQLYFYP